MFTKDIDKVLFLHPIMAVFRGSVQRWISSLMCRRLWGELRRISAYRPDPFLKGSNFEFQEIHGFEIYC